MDRRRASTVTPSTRSGWPCEPALRSTRRLARSATRVRRPHTAGRPVITPSRSGSTGFGQRSEEHTSELQSLRHLVCRLLLEKKKKTNKTVQTPYITKTTALLHTMYYNA